MNSASLEAEDGLSERLMELRNKVHDATYLKSAIERIALVLSRKLVESDAEADFSGAVVFR